MKQIKFLLTVWVTSLFTLFFTACNENDDPTPEIPVISKGVYILNQGKSTNNNATISYYDLESNKLTANVFETKNGIKLGDTGQDILIYGSKMYIAVSGSATIFVTDLDCNLLKTIRPTREGQSQQPRSMAANEGRVYITLFDGYLARLDTTSLSIDKQVKVGRNPEGVVAANNKLYVANSGGMDYPNCDNTVSVIDINSFTVNKSIEVVINPDNLTTDSQGDVYLISNGIYGGIPNTLQRIDTKTDIAQAITSTNASFFTSMGDKLYMVYAQWDDQGNRAPTKYITYNTINEQVVTDNFITDGTVIANPYKINCDVTTGNIYLSESDYVNTGNMYIFSQDGKKLTQFNTGGLNPAKIAFVTK